MSRAILSHRRHDAAKTAFSIRLERLAEGCRQRWQATSGAPLEAPAVTLTAARRRANHRRTDRLLDRLEAAGRAGAGMPEARQAELRDTLGGWAREVLGTTAEEHALLTEAPLLDATRAFVQRARGEMPSMAAGDLFQALRNVWIMNVAQLLAGRPVRITPSVYGYSMLYPVTDNALDDPDLPAPAKRRVNRWLAARLRGAGSAPSSPLEARIDGLLRAIEHEYPAPAWPDQWASLRAIHHAQVASLACQSGAGAALDVLAISIAKGGASVLADGYLAAGDLDPAGARFFFRYGVLLQLLDDLQDATADRDAGHRTLFAAERRRPLDAEVYRLLRFLDAVLDDGARLGAPSWPAVAGSIRRNCVLLAQQAVAVQPALVSRRCRHRLEADCPWSFRYLRRRQRTFHRRFAGLLRALTAAQLAGVA